MKNVYKALLNLFSKNEPKTDSPIIQEVTTSIEIITPIQAFVEDTAIQDLIDQLSYTHISKARQDEKRLRAFNALGEMGIEAKSAIPALIIKHFAFDAQEITWAKETLHKVAPQWYADDLAKETIYFLIKQLRKDPKSVSRAINLLKLMGEPAQKAALDMLSKEGNQDEYAYLNIIKFLGEQKPPNPDILPILNQIIQTSNNSNLLDVAAKLLGSFKEVGEEVIENLTILLKNETYTVRVNAINALDNLRANNDTTTAALLSCLSDNNDLVIENSIVALSKINNTVLDEFCDKTIACKGIMTEEQFRDIFEKISFGTSYGNFILSTNPNKYWNNIIWHNLHIKNQLAKPEVVLNAVLKILGNKKQAYPHLTHHIIDICKKNQNEHIEANAIRVLEHDTNNRGDIVSCLVSRLDTPSDIVRKANIDALNNLDKEWLQKPETINGINAVIDKLDGSDKKTNAEYLTLLGDNFIPFLIQRLAKTEKRTIQKAILEVLNDSGEGINRTNLAALVALKDRFADAHNAMAINKLIKKFEGESPSV